VTPVGDFIDQLFGVAALLLFFGVGWYLVDESQGLFRDALAMLLTRTIPASEVRKGRVEISGTARPADRTLTEPVEGGEALAYEYEVSQEEYLKDDLLDWTRWGYRQKAGGAAAIPFHVEDETGRVLVDPGTPGEEHEAKDGALNLYATHERKTHVDGDGTRPARMQGFFGRADLDTTEQGRVDETAAIEPGDEVYVLGTASFDGTDRVVEGGDGRFVAGASQLRTLLYSAGWGLTKSVVGVLLVVVCGGLLLSMAGVV
jgi:hypothetical protein